MVKTQNSGRQEDDVSEGQLYQHRADTGLGFIGRDVQGRTAYCCTSHVLFCSPFAVRWSADGTPE